MQRRWWVLVAAAVAFWPSLVVAQEELTDEGDLKQRLPTPEQWQVWCVLLGPLLIALVLRVVMEMSGRALLLHERRFIANFIIVLAAIIGLVWSDDLDNFRPSIVAFLALVIGVHGFYEFWWKGVPGFTHLIRAIDPRAPDSRPMTP